MNVIMISFKISPEWRVWPEYCQCRDWRLTSLHLSWFITWLWLCSPSLLLYGAFLCICPIL